MFIEFGGVRFWARGYRMRPGDTQVFGLRPGAWDAFTSTAGVATEDIARPGSDGNFALPGFLTGKVRPFSAVALARSSGELGHMNDVVAGLAGGYRRVVVNDGTRTRWAWGQVFGEVEFRRRRERYGGMYVADVDLSIRTPEPWWYGEVRSVVVPSGGTVEVENRGNARSWPRVEVRGRTYPGWELEIAGQGIRVPTGIATGETVVVERGRVVSDQRGPLSGVAGVTGPIMPGRALVRFDGGGTATVRVTDTWLNA